ncbi:hypothetical protein GCM10022236_20070 [Microlunatus ginsengisoli]|uniref:Secreted protein n=1 Tax=Microlunatus ginsengisoli TaxID=363863 RepID=A0ABP6ZV87_9ACTN
MLPIITWVQTTPLICTVGSASAVTPVVARARRVGTAALAVVGLTNAATRSRQPTAATIRRMTTTGAPDDKGDDACERNCTM